MYAHTLEWHGGARWWSPTSKTEADAREAAYEAYNAEQEAAKATERELKKTQKLLKDKRDEQARVRRARERDEQKRRIQERKKRERDSQKASKTTQKRKRKASLKVSPRKKHQERSKIVVLQLCEVVVLRMSSPQLLHQPSTAAASKYSSHANIGSKSCCIGL